MDHREALEMHAAERYVLGELTIPQRDAFEEHYFECMYCAGDVKAAAAFTDNAREALRAEPKKEIVAAPEPKPVGGGFGWFRPAFALGAMALLLAVLAYQNLVTIPQMKRDSEVQVAQALPTVSLMTSGTRGAGDLAQVEVRPGAPFGVFVDIPASEKFDSYRCEVRAKDGSEKLNIDVSATQARDTVQLFIPGGKLEAGEYEVVVVGKSKGASEELARHGFVVKQVP